MQKILIIASDPLITQLEEKLRIRFDVETMSVSQSGICEIRANLKRNWITICRFSATENLRDILTMFDVNYELKSRSSQYP
ncbi:hypothetical protein [Candidatus Nitrosocosmicus hydrocola]|jgi:hypothetical protein|uniref:hypothetical protein n=1 Tax=Candidatus Nitrosocosmicus hydrocola TaxID=1826872 RepID=UPI0011E5EE1F|nr:hypothetical protein [Candidatus Nitrosocosmicus hydrocola]